MPDKKLLDRFGRRLAADMSAAGVPDELLADKELAAELMLSVQTLQVWRAKGSGPPFIRVSGKCIRYSRRAVAAWLEQRAALSTSDYAHSRGPGRPAKKVR